MYATIGPLTPLDAIPLMPAPSVRDIEDMPEPTSDVGLNERPLLITWTYRGYLLYLENGASVYRDSSTSAGGNGLLSGPTGPETCIIVWRGKAYRAIVYFDSNVESQAPQA
jgi:hypothetical protein